MYILLHFRNTLITQYFRLCNVNMNIPSVMRENKKTVCGDFGLWSFSHGVPVVQAVEEFASYWKVASFS